MKTREELIAEFIAKNGVTKCPPRPANARSLKQMRRDEDRRIAEEAAALRAEYDAERRSEQAAELAACGQRCIGFDEFGDALSWADLDEEGF